MVSRFNFRVWGKNTKNFVIGMNIFMRGSKYALSQIDKFLNPITLASENYIIMQSTGLEDRNGKEIFEGDIVKIVGTNEIFPVKYYNNFCCFGLKVEQDGTRGICYNLDKKIAKDIEVIGNIYENKELLEK